jgi:hypothetical protein
VLHEDLPAEPEAFLQAIAPYRDGLVVACECLFCWYWLADLCAAQKIAFVLGHALYMKAIHGGKTKDDKIDSKKIALRNRAGERHRGQRLERRFRPRRRRRRSRGCLR